LLNGAAATAVLAFLATKNGLNAVPALYSFLIGTLVAVLATGSAYFSAYSENRSIWKWVEGNDLASRRRWHLTVFFQCLATVFVLYSYFRFWLGVEAAITAIEALNK